MTRTRIVVRYSCLYLLWLLLSHSAGAQQARGNFASLRLEQMARTQRFGEREGDKGRGIRYEEALEKIHRHEEILAAHYGGKKRKK